MKWSNSAYIELDKEIHSVGIEHSIEQNCRKTVGIQCFSSNSTLAFIARPNTEY